MVLRRLKIRREENSALYWKYLGVWVVGGLISVSCTIAIFEWPPSRNYVSDLNIFSLLILAVLFSPMLAIGIYGLRNNYYPWWPGEIIRGPWSRAVNLLIIAVYIGFIFMGYKIGQ